MRQEKINNAINRLKKGAELAARYGGKPLYLCFSGGKDSQCIYHLAELAGVAFEPHYNLTTIDPPEVVQFIKKQYPNVIIDRPKMTMWQLIEKHRMLPTQTIRYCCSELKEINGAGRVCVIGVRRAESTRRAKRNEIEISGRKYSGSIDEFNIALNGQSVVTNCMAKFGSSKDKIMILPIIDWSDKDVWEFLSEQKIKSCKLYQEGKTRIGCILCPMSSKKSLIADLNRYPKYVDAYKRVIERLMRGGYFKGFESADDVLKWWFSKESVGKYLAAKKQLTLNL